MQPSPPARSPGPVLGILGAGQLALMLADAARRLGAAPRVLAGSAKDPAVVAGIDAVVGVGLDAFLASVDVAIIESELLDTEAVASASRSAGVTVWPKLAAIAVCKDKLRQKEAFDALRIPTSPWLACRPGESVGAWLDEARARFPTGFVVKWANGGYDGRGVMVSRPGAGDAAELAAFAQMALARNSAVYAEELVAFVDELAVVATRTQTGEIASYPLVLSAQDRGVCRVVRGPATALGVQPALEQEARGIAEALARGLDLVGTFAVELFLTADGHLLVNEMAPRVHNSGHYTMDACEGSQFENHVRAVLGMPLGSTRPHALFAMLNVLGPDGVEGRVVPPTLPPVSGCHLHWYGKADSRPRRKLGHVNVVADSPAALAASLAAVEAAVAQWEASQRETRR